MSDSKAKTEGFNPDDFYLDEPITGIAAEEILMAARLGLVMKYPFFGKVALNMAFVETERVPTTAVDARGTFYFNRKWVNHFTKEDALFEMGHEVMHLVQRLWARQHGGVNHGLWNLAADYLADTALIDAGLPQSATSKLMCTDEKQKLAKIHDTVPAMYKYLLVEAEENTDCPACKAALKDLLEMQETKKKAEQKENKAINGGDEDGDDADGEGEGEGSETGNSGSCGGNSPAPKHTCGNVRQCCAGSSADAQHMEAADEQKWTEIVVGAKIHAEGKGNMPAGLGEYIDELTKSKVRWQDHLKAAATRLFGRDRYTFKRTNRRGPAMGMRIPGRQPDGRNAVVAIDTSASMSTEEVRQCITEAREILTVCGCEKIWLILHDTRVYFSDYVQAADLTTMKMARGGTSHDEVFQVCERKHSNPEFNVPRDEEVTLAVMFTDLGTDFPTQHPAYEVVWGVPSNGYPGMTADVPFGKKVMVELGDN